MYGYAYFSDAPRYGEGAFGSHGSIRGRMAALLLLGYLAGGG